MASQVFTSVKIFALPAAPRTNLTSSAIHDNSGPVDPLLGPDCTHPYIYIYARLPRDPLSLPLRLRRLPLVVLKQAAQSFPAPHCSLFPSCLRLKRKQYAILLALMVPLFMVMQQILLQGSPQRTLST